MSMPIAPSQVSLALKLEIRNTKQQCRRQDWLKGRHDVPFGLLLAVCVVSRGCANTRPTCIVECKSIKRCCLVVAAVHQVMFCSGLGVHSWCWWEIFQTEQEQQQHIEHLCLYIRIEDWSEGETLKEQRGRNTRTGVSCPAGWCGAVVLTFLLFAASYWHSYYFSTKRGRCFVCFVVGCCGMWSCEDLLLYSSYEYILIIVGSHIISYEYRAYVLLAATRERLKETIIYTRLLDLIYMYLEQQYENEKTSTRYVPGIRYLVHEYTLGIPGVWHRPPVLPDVESSLSANEMFDLNFRILISSWKFQFVVLALYKASDRGCTDVRYQRYDMSYRNY